MAGRQSSKKGKELAVEPSGGPAVINNPQILIDDQECTLIIESNKILGTPLQRATCDGKHCVAISKNVTDAYSMHNTLNKCDHPNIAKSIGVWTDPSDQSKAYIVLMSVDNTLSSLEKQRLFCIKDDLLCGFSEYGFKVFMEIFSAVQYVNNKYVGGATSSTSTDTIELFPLMLEPKNIFMNRQGQVILGNFKMKLSEKYIKKNKRRVPQETTRDDIEAAHWKEVGHCLKSLRGTFTFSAELNELLLFLTEAAVTYDDLLWKADLWDATTKMEFIREIFWFLDMQRDGKDSAIESTPKGQLLMSRNPLGLLKLMKMFSPPKDRNNNELKIKEDHLLDSVLFLRHKIIAHYDEEYKSFKGPKAEIGTTKEEVERYVQKCSAEYMIKLAEAIRELGWITESPVMRDENNYMAAFYKMKK